MKVLKSNSISAFGGLNFVIEEFDKKRLGKILNENLPKLSAQSQYDWKDLLYSFWSVFFCGGDCAEDLSGNFKPNLSQSPKLKVPSPDRVLNRLKRSEEHTSELQSRGHLVCRLLLEKKNHITQTSHH